MPTDDVTEAEETRGGPEGQGLRGVWQRFSVPARGGIVVLAILLLVAGGLLGALVSGGDPETSQAQDDPTTEPCSLLSRDTAADLLGEDVERHRIVDSLPPSPSPGMLRQAQAADAKNCVFVSADVPSVEEGDFVALQIDRFLFRSRDEFLGAFDHYDHERIQGMGEAALLWESDRGGWDVSVLVNEEFSLALHAGGEEVSREEVLGLAREITSRLVG